MFMANKTNIPSSERMMQCLVAGLERLVEGQKQFAEEFGLSFSRIFPNTEELGQEKGVTQLIREWLTGETEQAEENLQQLFDALVKHQLALTAALDGIALQAIQELTSKRKNTRTGIQALLSKKPKMASHELKNNQRLRFQRIIVPGFINAYMRVREKLL